jgi:hypothetical protein
MKRLIYLTSTILTAALLIPAPSGAQNDRVRNKVEKATDRKEIRQDARATRDDARDLARLQQLRSEFEAARASSDKRALHRVDEAVAGYLAGEKAESQKETAAAEREVRRSRREKRSDRREIRDNRREGASPLERLDDRHDLRDDRRDLRDDQRDAAVEKTRREKIETIRTAWTAMQGNYDPASLERRARLLDDLVGLADGEISSDTKEGREDRRELREDRRETREDRRQK